MLLVVLPWIVSICLLWSLAYLLVLCSRKRLPFYQAEVIETHLSEAIAQSGSSRFVVRFRISRPAGAAREVVLPFVLNGKPARARESARYRELQAHYSVGNQVRMHHVPHGEWAFGLVPEWSGFGPRGVFAAVVAISLAALVWMLYLGGFGAT